MLPSFFFFSRLVAPFLLSFKYLFPCTVVSATAKPLLARVKCRQPSVSSDTRGVTGCFVSPSSEELRRDGVTRGRLTLSLPVQWSTHLTSSYELLVQTRDHSQASRPQTRPIVLSGPTTKPTGPTGGNLAPISMVMGSCATYCMWLYVMFMTHKR